LNTKCIKCGEIATKSTLHNHLVNCHGFGLYQCVYCRFGTNTFGTISSHLANEHPSFLPLFCERTPYKINNNADPKSAVPLTSSIESTCLKHINQEVHRAVFVKQPTNDKLLKNSVNVGCLGEIINTPRKICVAQEPNKELPSPIFKVVATPISKADKAKLNVKDSLSPLVIYPPPSKVSAHKATTSVAPRIVPPTTLVHKFRKPVHQYSLAPLSASPQVTIVQKSPVSILPAPVPAPPKSVGLQIQSVFSLSNAVPANFNNFLDTPANKYIPAKKPDSSL